MHHYGLQSGSRLPLLRRCVWEASSLGGQFRSWTFCTRPVSTWWHEFHHGSWGTNNSDRAPTKTITDHLAAPCSIAHYRQWRYTTDARALSRNRSNLARVLRDRFSRMLSARAEEPPPPPLPSHPVLGGGVVGGGTAGQPEGGARHMRKASNLDEIVDESGDAHAPVVIVMGSGACEKCPIVKAVVVRTCPLRSWWYPSMGCSRPAIAPLPE